MTASVVGPTGTLGLDISELSPDFPEFRVGLVVAVGLELDAPAPGALSEALSSVVAEVARGVADRPLAEIDALKVWRAAYKAFGVRKTSYRSSVERLLKHIQQGRGMPRVNNLVDCYNAVSARHRVPIGADDLDRVAGGLAFRYARDGDTFHPLGGAPGAGDPPKPGEAVYADGEKLLCRRWNWYQDGRSATSAATRRAVLTVQSLGGGTRLELAIDELRRWLTAYCGARTALAVAESAHPRVAIDLA